MHGHTLTVLPGTAPFDSRAEVPQPLGLVGAHRSRRIGDGSEFSGIRPFHVGDRLRRINWRASLRSESLHVVATRSEEDSAVLIVVDALAEHGVSGGIDGASSSLDVSVRAAAALAEHYVRRGDRVGLRVLGGRWREPDSCARGATAPPSACRGRWRGCGRASRVTSTPTGCASGPAPGPSSSCSRRCCTRWSSPPPPRWRGAGSRSSWWTPFPRARPRPWPRDTDPVIADLAWRMRLTDREVLFARLSRIGCPAVPWRGPGTLDDVLHRLARRAQLPQVRAR